MMSDKHDQHSDYSFSQGLLSQYLPKQKQRGGEGGAYFILLSLEGVLIGRVVLIQGFTVRPFLHSAFSYG